MKDLSDDPLYHEIIILLRNYIIMIMMIIIIIIIIIIISTYKSIAYKYLYTFYTLNDITTTGQKQSISFTNYTLRSYNI